MPPFWSILVFSLVIPICCGFLGSLFQNWLADKSAKGREADARQHADLTAAKTRKLAFLGFMDGWRTKIERVNIQFVADQFDSDCSEFRKEATKIRGDYGPGFWELVDSLSALHRSEIEEGANQGDRGPGKIKLLTRVDTVTNFVRAN